MTNKEIKELEEGIEKLEKDNSQVSGRLASVEETKQSGLASNSDPLRRKDKLEEEIEEILRKFKLYVITNDEANDFWYNYIDNEMEPLQNKLNEIVKQAKLTQNKKDIEMFEKMIDYTFADMEALLRHRFEGENKFEEILDEIFNYREELKSKLGEMK